MSYPRSGPGGWLSEGQQARDDAAELTRLRSEVRRLRRALREIIEIRHAAVAVSRGPIDPLAERLAQVAAAGMILSRRRRRTK